MKRLDTITILGSNSATYRSILRYVPKGSYSKQDVKTINTFLTRLNKAVNSRTPEFKIPIYDSFLDMNGNLQFVAGRDPAVGFSINELIELGKLSNMQLGNINQWYLFLGTLLYRMLNKGYTYEEAIKAIVFDSRRISYRWVPMDGENIVREKTGSLGVTGVFDLGNTCKLVLGVTDEKYFEVAGSYSCGGIRGNMIDTARYSDRDVHFTNAVGWFTTK